MQLLWARDVPERAVTARAGHHPFAHLVLFAFLLPAVALPVFLAVKLWDEAPLALRVLGGVVMLLVMLFWTMVLGGLAGGVAACFRPSNWVMKATPEGIYLKFRSYLNAHYPEDGPTVVYLPYGDLASARRVREEWQTLGKNDRIVRRTSKWLELRLRHRETEDLRLAIAAEMQRRGPRKSFLGISGSSRAPHVPVIVPEPGLVRAEWRGKAMLAALNGRVAAAGDLPEHDAGLAVGAGDGLPLEERALRLVQRGDRIAACALVRAEREVDHTEAKRFVDEVVEKNTHRQRLGA